MSRSTLILVGVTLVLVAALVLVVAIVYIGLSRPQVAQPLGTPSGEVTEAAVPGTRVPPPVTPPPASTWYDLYFTSPKFPDDPANHNGSVDVKLAAFINSAQKSVDMAIYQLDLPNVTQALLDAKKRGATVRLVTDIDILNDKGENPSFKTLQGAGIPVVGGNPNGIMHNKFVVVDNAAVWTGSWNFTVNDTYRYNNNGILIRSPELANNYTVTFEKMFKNKKFAGARKPGGTTQQLTVGGIPVENYFAPEDNVADKIVARLKTAAKTIDFMAFSFTHDGMGDAILARAQNGAKVRGVFEKTGSETKFSEYGKFKQAGLDVWQDGNPYLMHHKVFIIDGKTVIFGSFNFSDGADKDNDENLLIIDGDVNLVRAFNAEFARVYDQARNPPSR